MRLSVTAQNALITAANLMVSHKDNPGDGTLEKATSAAVLAVGLVNDEAAAGEVDNPDFDGATYDPARDQARLRRQLGRVFEALADGQWHTLENLKATCGGTEAALSARLRDLRKAKFGHWLIDHRRHDAGFWLYRMRNPDGTVLPPVQPRAGDFIPLTEARP